MMSGGESAKVKQHLKDIVKVIMQPELNEPYLEPQRSYKTGFSRDAGEYRERNWGTLCLGSCPTGSDSQYEYRNSTESVRSDYSAQTTDRPSGGNFTTSKHRIVGKEALEILRRSHGAVGEIIQAGSDKANHPEERPRSRLPSEEAKKNEVRHRGSTVRNCLNPADIVNLALTKPRMKGLPTKEAEQNYKRNQGTAFSHSPPTLPPKQPTESRGRALWNKGICALVITGKVSGDPVPAARVRGEGMDIYSKSQGSRLLLHHSVHKPSAVAPRPKSTLPNASNERRCQSAAPPRRRSESRRYSRKYPASMADCLVRYL